MKKNDTPRAKYQRRKRPFRLCVVCAINENAITYVTDHQYANTQQAIKDAQVIAANRDGEGQRYFVIQIAAEFEVEVETTKTAKVRML